MAVETDDLTENGDVSRDNRLIVIIFRLETDMISLAVVTLYRCFLTTYECNDDITVVRGILLCDDEEISFLDPRIDHGITADGQDETRDVSNELCRKGEHRFDIFLCDDRRARTNDTDDRCRDDLLTLPGGHLLRELDGTRTGRIALDHAELLETAEIAVHSRGRTETDRSADLSDGRGVTGVLDLFSDIIQNFSLSVCKCAVKA